MYTVALHTTDHAEFAITVRNFDKSKHWKVVNSNPRVMVDSRETVYKPFTEIATFDEKEEAEQFATVIKAAYALAKWEQISVKVKKQKD